jgi:peptide/nickel transport system ATP-binding protein
MSLLEVADLTIRYGSIDVVAGVDFCVDRGESVGLVGESGAGKSQTALAVLGLLPTAAKVSGSIRVDGAEILGKPEDELNKIRATRIGMVFQDSTQALNPYLRVGAQLRQIVLRHSPASGVEADARVIEMLARVGLPKPLQQSRAYSHELSGGMRQRVMIAAALIGKPDLLVADEPTTALDVTVQAQILALLEESRGDTALLLITHDLGVIAGYCERMLVMQAGRLIEAGATRAVFATAQQAHTQELLQAARSISASAPLLGATGKPVLTVDALSVDFVSGDRHAVSAVVGVSLQLHAAETLAIVGESGSGKSSLVRAVLGLIPKQSGRVVCLGEDLVGPVATRGLATRRDLQLIFQEPQSALSPSFRVQDIIAEPLTVHVKELSKTERDARVGEVLQNVGLERWLLGRFPHQLSGGQAQRVAIARALVLRPRVLICDEAVAALDGTVRQQILDVLKSAQADTGLAIIFISHDLAVVRSISHRILVMYQGRLVEVADGPTLFGAPRHPYSRALLAAVPVPDPLAGRPSAILRGDTPSLAEATGCTFYPRCEFANERCAQQAPHLRNIGASQVACHRAEEI